MLKIGERVYLRGNAGDVREVLEFRNDEVGHVEDIEKATFVLVRSADGRGVCGWGLDAVVSCMNHPDPPYFNEQPPADIFDVPDEREAMAAQCHEMWSGWMRWMFQKGTYNADGTWTMPAENVQRWMRQMNTFYGNLPENEKESDRVEADKIFALLNAESGSD